MVNQSTHMRVSCHMVFIHFVSEHVSGNSHGCSSTLKSVG